MIRSLYAEILSVLIIQKIPQKMSIGGETTWSVFNIVCNCHTLRYFVDICLWNLLILSNFRFSVVFIIVTTAMY